MIDLILGQLAPYVMILLGVVAAWFGVSSKIKSSTIKKQDDAIKAHQENEDTLIQVIETQKQTAKQVEKANEILNEPSNLDASVERLREQARARENRNKDKV